MPVAKKKVEWEAVQEEHFRCCAEHPPLSTIDAEAREARKLAADDLKEFQAYLRRAKNRRAVPAWSAPLELWWMLLLPKKTLRK